MNLKFLLKDENDLIPKANIKLANFLNKHELLHTNAYDLTLKEWWDKLYYGQTINQEK